MTHTELRTLLVKNGISQREMARLIGIDERTMRRYCLAEYEIPSYIAYAIQWQLKNKEQK